MDVIELECPHCGDALELDAAFAGGVCRCSTCGTLMTVPADPSRDRAETLTRSERPDSPGGRPSVPGGRPDVPGARPDTPGERPDVPGGRAESPARNDNYADELAALAGAEAAPVAALPADDVYITASGKSLKLATAVVPTARKRKKVIRATVIGIFIAMVLGLIGIIILAAMLLFGDNKPKVIETPDIVGIDPSVNPIKAAEPNLLSIPIGKEAAIIIDATNFARQWFPMMQEIIRHEVSLSSSIDYLIIPWTDLSPKPFQGKKPAKIGGDKQGELSRFLDDITVTGENSPLPFVQLALDERADQIIIIAGRILVESEITALKEAIAKRVDTQVDAIIIGDHDAALQQLAADNKGKYVSVKMDQLQKWYEDWKKPAN